MRRITSILFAPACDGRDRRAHRYLLGLQLAEPAVSAFKTFIVLLSLASPMAVKAIEPPDTVTTFTLSQGQADIGLFSSYRHGPVNDLQINTFPHSRLLFPNLTIKKSWGSLSGWQFSSTHAFSYPILLADPAACPDGCDLFSASGPLPQMLSVNSHFYFSRHLSDSLVVTPSISVALTAGSPSAVDLSLYNRQINPYHNGYSINTGIDIGGAFSNNWGYSADLEYFSMAGLEGDTAWEHKAMLFYEWNKNQRVSIGYKYTSGLDLFGSDAHTLPMLDFLWSWE